MRLGRRADRGQDAFVIKVMFETHSLSEDNERGAASGWALGSSTPRTPVARAGGRRSPGSGASSVTCAALGRPEGAGHRPRGRPWALDHHVAGVPLETLVSRDFAWREYAREAC
jgi:hypothetical protein